MINDKEKGKIGNERWLIQRYSFYKNANPLLHCAVEGLFVMHFCLSTFLGLPRTYGVKVDTALFLIILQRRSSILLCDKLIILAALTFMSCQQSNTVLSFNVNHRRYFPNSTYVSYNNFPMGFPRFQLLTWLSFILHISWGCLMTYQIHDWSFYLQRDQNTFLYLALYQLQNVS